MTVPHNTQFVIWFYLNTCVHVINTSFFVSPTLSYLFLVISIFLFPYYASEKQHFAFSSSRFRYSYQQLTSGEKKTTILGAFCWTGVCRFVKKL
ncbi:hypothetical protein VNO77_33503 [Canavalia gladiata]|uniref:Uncharacterized protein n=1 Tax=Canavalia gladiata TaxID=3824 RepID=A0AAN9KDW3_CANGL